MPMTSATTEDLRLFLLLSCSVCLSPVSLSLHLFLSLYSLNKALISVGQNARSVRLYSKSRVFRNVCELQEEA